jgi:carbamoyl-phosphate synthase large subunit
LLVTSGEMDSEAIKPTHYKELIIWQRSMELAKSIYRLTAMFPVEEKYGLAAQMRRTAVAIPSAIAEGQARYGSQEFLHFLSRTSGFLAELETQVLLGIGLKFSSQDATSEILTGIGEIQKMVTAIRRKLGAASH